AERFEQIYRNWITAESNIQLFTQIEDVCVEESEGRIVSLGFQSLEINPGSVVDCTGSAAVVRNSSSQRIEPAEPALAGYMLRLSNVVSNDMLPIRVPHVLWKAVDAGHLPPVARYTVFDQDMLKVSATPDTDAEQLAVEIVKVLKAKIPEFQGLEIAETSGAVLQREGIRMKGEVVLSADDVRSGRKFSDVVARGCWPMEFWDAERGVQYAYVEGDGSYDIPRRALKASNLSNLWTAGRSISADSMALSSARVVGTCIATGDAAGRAAAREAA
ncbi:MAG: FAD-dependent oxidoreductase, partial [Kiritimatiellaceae bacterium]|nr:FAD-dependent oxidoreductase [Kiritimatiellaceae bacterium]